MPVEVDSDSLEAKILDLLMVGKPITLEEVAKELGISKKKIERTVKGLASRGIVEIEELPDKKYLRLKRKDIKFQGVNPSQREAVKHKKKGEDEDKGSEKSRDMMYR